MPLLRPLRGALYPLPPSFLLPSPSLPVPLLPAALLPLACSAQFCKQCKTSYLWE